MQGKFYELTNPQKSIWYTEEVFKGTPIENISGTALISEKVNFKKLEKPKTKESAKEMLKLLSGRVNYAVTGVTIVDKYQDKTITFYEVTEVYFDEMSDEEMDWYIENEEFIFERCGYSIAGKSAIYIPKINGDYYNILGMPISRVYKELHKLGYNLDDFE